MSDKLYTKEKIVKKLKMIYDSGGDENVFLVSTKDYDLTTNPKKRNENKERCDWIDVEVADKLYGIKDRSKIIKQDPRRLSTGEYNFAYIKFACDNVGNVYGIVSGKSSFYALNPSDVWFYDIDIRNTEAAKRMKEQNLTWYDEEILIVKNVDALNSDEAFANEKKIKKLFSLSD